MPGYFNPEDYIDVQERIVKFWAENPDGRINTELISNPSDFERVAVRAAVFKHKDHPHPTATGMANEWKGGGMAQAAAWLETCETSAIGRAFANMGYAVKNSARPSRQEMEKVQRHAGEAPTHEHRPDPTPIDRPRPAPQQGNQQWTNRNPPSDKQIGMMNKLIAEKNLDDAAVDELALASSNGYSKTFTAMSKQDASKFIDALMNGTAPQTQQQQGGYANGRQEAATGDPNAATTPQKNLIARLAREHNVSEGWKSTYCEENFGVGWDDLSKEDAKQMIEWLKSPEFTPI